MFINMSKVNKILAVHCLTPEDFRKVFDKLHASGLEKEGLPLFNVHVHNYEFNLGMRYVMLYINTREVKVALKVDNKNSKIHVVSTEAFLKNV